MSHPGDTRTVAASAPPERLTLRKYALRPVGEASEGKTFDRRLTYVGSGPDNDLIVDDASVSRAHCKIEGDRNGLRLVDLGSKNGTFVNGVRVSEAWLPERCRLRLGATDLDFELRDERVEVQLSAGNRFGRLLGCSLQMREIFALLARVAPTDATVLVEGESGTGKELVAQALHEKSQRARGKFVVFDCSAVPPQLIESELFGHVKGAFTGADSNRVGAFEAASGGTLFLDEIGELPLDLQPRLLRVLESKEVKPVGSNARVPVDCRIVAATNRDLQREVDGGQFREDLYYRLAVIHVDLPPLRQRPEDLALLVNAFVDELRPDGRFQIGFSTMDRLKRHEWPGNVRELRNFVERAALLSDDADRIDTRLIAGPRRTPPDLVAARTPADVGPDVLPAEYTLPFKDAKSRLVDAFERAYWTRLLERTDGNVSEAARRGGIHRKSLEYLLKKLDLS